MITISDNPKQYFQLIRSGLIEANANSGEYNTIGNIYEALNTGQWVLHMFWSDDNEYLGFGMTEAISTANGPWVNVPFAYSKCNMYDEFFSHVQELAYDDGFTGVKFISCRPGFEKKAKDLGWKKGFTEWIVKDFRD